mgnify:CR=1 FL=1|tara:strand:- start:1134 stop:1388 length:255 start_codon:yes stop_codon:yes gene_type:complete
MQRFPKKKKATPKKRKDTFVYPEDTDQWLSDLIDIGESVVLSYEGYLLDQVDHVQLSRAMQKLRATLPMKSKKPRFFEKDNESK